jgi:hypothetical protein
MLPARRIFKFKYLKYLYLIRIKVTPSNGLVGSPDFFSGIAMGSMQTNVVKLSFIKALLHHPMMA